MKGFGSASLQLESNDLLHLNDVLYVPSIKRNLVSISTLEDKGYRVTFAYGNVLAWHKNSSMNTAKVIGVREESLYRLNTLPTQALVHDSTNINELWHIRLAHLNYQALPTLRNMVTSLRMLHEDHVGICRGCALGKNTKGSFPKSESRSKGILDLVHSEGVHSSVQPTKNGVVERKNRIVVKASKAMIHYQSLPMFLWS